MVVRENEAPARARGRSGLARGRADRTTVVLLLVLLPLGAATLAGLFLLWPGQGMGRTGIVEVEREFRTASVVRAVEDSCAGTNEDRQPDGTVPTAVPCTLVTFAVPGAPPREVDVWAPATVGADDLAPGTKVVLARYLATDDAEELWAWSDYDRTLPLGVMTAAYALVVIAVAGLRGLRALLGLAFAFAVVGFFMLPAVLEKQDAPTVALVASATIMFVVLYLAHGISRRTTTALIGTFAGLAVTAGLGAVAAQVAHLNGISTEDNYRVAQLTGQLGGDNLRGLFLAGVMLAGLGVLNDVTITQAAAVWELRAADPTATRRQLFVRGMRIGRDHIASTVYTIALAYTGAALPILLLVQLYRLPLLQTVSSGEFAEEIARTAVGSIGLVLAIPLTTLIAAVVVTASALPPGPRHRALTASHVGHAH